MLDPHRETRAKCTANGVRREIDRRRVRTTFRAHDDDFPLNKFYAIAGTQDASVHDAVVLGTGPPPPCYLCRRRNHDCEDITARTPKRFREVSDPVGRTVVSPLRDGETKLSATAPDNAVGFQEGVWPCEALSDETARYGVGCSLPSS
jgi:hypothetical protein